MGSALRTAGAVAVTRHDVLIEGGAPIAATAETIGRNFDRQV
jgi:hypothetical protein